MKMGLGFWKFTTLVLLFVLAFMNKVEGNKTNNNLESRQKGSADDEFEVTSIFLDCASHWLPKSGDPCYRGNENEARSGVRSESLGEAYRRVKEMFEKRCEEERGLDCYKGVCDCDNTEKCKKSHAQDRDKNCVKEFRAYFEFEKRKLDNSRSSVFGPRPQFEYMLWTSILFIVVVNVY